MIREYFLQQNAYHEVDTFCPMDKQFKLLKSIMSWGDKAIMPWKAVRLLKI